MIDLALSQPIPGNPKPFADFLRMERQKCRQLIKAGNISRNKNTVVAREQVSPDSERLFRSVFKIDEHQSRKGRPVKLMLPVSTLLNVQSRPAARPERGKALKIGLLCNTKPNGDAVIESVFDMLAVKGIAAEAVVRTKPDAGHAMKPEVLADLSQCDLVLNAIAN